MLKLTALLLLMTGCSYLMEHPKIVEDVIEEEVELAEKVMQDSHG